MATILIEGKEVNARSKVVLSKQVYPQSDWNSRTIQFSENVTIDYVPFIKFNKYYNFVYKDNSQILFNGFAILLERNKKETLSIQLLDKSKLLLDFMTDNKLTALDLDSQDFIFNTTSYNNLKQLNATIWLWSADNTHEKRTLANSILSGNLAYSRPYFSVKRLFELILNNLKWKYTLSDNALLFDKLILSSNHKDFYFTSYEKLFSFNQFANTYNFNFTNYDFIKTDSLSSNTVLSLNYDSQIRLRGNIYAEKDCVLNIVCVSSLSTDSITESYTINKGLNYYDLTSAILKTDDTTYNVSINIVANCNIETSDLLVYTKIKEEAFGDISLANFTDFKVKTYDNIIDLTQIQLFKQCLALVGGFFTTDNLRKKIKINSLNELFRLNSIDYSNKFVEQSENISSLDGYAKKNYFGYNTSDNKNIANNYFSINNDILIETKDVFNCIFEASNEVVINSDTLLDNVIYSNLERLETYNILLAYYENINDYSVARFDKLTGANIFKTYYDNYIKAIQKGEVFDADFYLSKSDYYNFDFTKLIYIEQLQTTFYVLEINNYIENENTSLKLLKV